MSLLQKTPHYREVGEIAARLKVKLCVLRDCVLVVVSYPFLVQSSLHGDKKPKRKLKAGRFGIE